MWWSKVKKIKSTWDKSDSDSQSPSQKFQSWAQESNLQGNLFIFLSDTALQSWKGQEIAS